MAKLLFFSDLHLANWPQFSKTDPDTGLNSRLVDQLTVLAQLKDIAEREHVDAILFLGDLFHSRTKIDVDVLWAAHESLYQLSRAAPEFYILVGNHDQSTKDGSIHSLDGFRYFANVIDEPKVLTVAGELTVAFHPFTTDFNAFRAYAKEVKADIFCCHQGLTEALVGAYELPIKADVSVEDLPYKSCRYVFLGHYHKHQWVRENVAYIGSPLQLDFGERREEKGFLLLDTRSENRRVKKWDVDFIPSSAPRFRLYETVALFETALKSGSVNPDRDFIRVHGQAKELRKVQEDCPRAQVIQEAVAYEHPTRVDPNMTASDRSLLSAYIEHADTTLDKDRLLKLGLDLLGGE